MSRRGCDGGRKKGVIDSRRGVNCPVSDCDVSGRIDYVKKHFNKLIVWSKPDVNKEDLMSRRSSMLPTTP